MAESYADGLKRMASMKGFVMPSDALEVSTSRSLRSMALDVTQLSLSGMSIAALARVYTHMEARRTPLSIRDLLELAQWEGASGGYKAVEAIEDLFRSGLIELNGQEGVGRSGDRRQVEITNLGARWFELNCDYRRECNVARYHTRFGTAGIFEFDPRRPLGRRMLDPLVPAAAVFGAVFATLICWLYP